MKKILAFSGSNSENSVNTKLVKYAASQVKNHEVSVIDLRDYSLPLYGIDLEKGKGIPENAHKLKMLIDDHDGFIISVPEHNRAVPAFFKNTIDWISRIHMSFFEHRPILLMSTSPGPGGGRNALANAENIMGHYMAGDIIGKFFMPRFYQNTDNDTDGVKIKDEELNNELLEQIGKLEKRLNLVTV